MPELTAKLAEADRRARGWLHPGAGLADLSRLYHANGFFDEAVQCYRGLRQLEADQAQWPYLQASVLSGFGNLDDAIPLFRASIAQEEFYLPAYLALAQALIRSDRTDEAAALLERAARAAPTNAHIRLGLAQCAVWRENWEVAERHAQQAIAMEPFLFDGWALMVTVQERRGDVDAARQARQRASICPPSRPPADPWLDALLDHCFDAYRLSVAAAATTDQARSRTLLERAIALAPSTAAFRRHLGILFLEAKEHAAARQQFEKACTLDPRDADAWAYLVRTLVETGQAPAASKALEAGLGYCPQSAALHYAKGKQLHAQGQFAAAIAALEESKRLAPSETRACIELSIIYFKQQRWDDGRNELQSALRIDPGHPVAAQILARLAIQEGDRSAAQHWVGELRRHGRSPARELDMVEREYRTRFGSAP